MNELIFFGLIILAIPLVPFVLSIRAYMRIGRMERSIEDLEQRVDRLYAAAVAGQQRELRDAREARVHPAPEPEPPRVSPAPLIPAPAPPSAIGADSAGTVSAESVRRRRCPGSLWLVRRFVRQLRPRGSAATAGQQAGRAPVTSG